MNKKLTLLCGSGGVGKTTITAALALKKAQEGQDILCMTVDPARRLADAFNLKVFGNEIHTFKPQKPSIHITGSLRISMIDVHDSADRLVDRYAPSIQIAERIKGNPVFRSGIASMSGIEEYIALGRVFELYQDEQFDELIIDSAPTRYAINFFKTPDKLLNVLNPENIQQILKSLHRYKNDGIKPNFKNSNPLIRKTFEMLGGKLLIQNFADFADDLKHFFDKFRCRVHQINSILRNTDMTTILLITRPDYRAFEESKKIFDDLTTSNLTIKHVIINQVTRSFFPEKIEKEILHYFQQHLAFNNFETAKRRVIRQIKTDRRIHNSEIDIIRNYINLLKSDAKFIQIPRFAQTSNAVELLTAFFKYLEDPVFARWQSNGDIGR